MSKRAKLIAAVWLVITSVLSFFYGRHYESVERRQLPPASTATPTSGLRPVYPQENDIRLERRASELLTAIRTAFIAARDRNGGGHVIRLHVRPKSGGTGKWIDIPLGTSLQHRRVTPAEGGRAYGVLANVLQGDRAIAYVFVAMDEDDWEFVTD